MIFFSYYRWASHRCLLSSSFGVALGPLSRVTQTTGLFREGRDCVWGELDGRVPLRLEDGVLWGLLCGSGRLARLWFVGAPSYGHDSVVLGGAALPDHTAVIQ